MSIFDFLQNKVEAYLPEWQPASVWVEQVLAAPSVEAPRPEVERMRAVVKPVLAHTPSFLAA